VAFLYLKQCHLRGKNTIPAPVLTLNRSELGREKNGRLKIDIGMKERASRVRGKCGSCRNMDHM